MPSPRSAFRWLIVKEWRELVASPAWWVLLVLTGPLVGVCFITAVRAYAEVSAGATQGCGIACAPLIGIWGPTFSAYEIAAVFLLPFVAIRAVAGDRQSGALSIELQRPLSPHVRVAAKAIVLIVGWLATGAAGLAAVLLWSSYGGATAGAEIIVAAAGHLLNGALTIALALAVATMTDHPSTAAIVTLAMTIGTWVVAFASALYGGLWDQLASFTPAALVSMFQHGLVEVNVTAAAVVVVITALAIAAVWLRLGDTIARRSMATAGVVAAAVLVAGVATQLPGSWDASESRYNSFSEERTEALERLPGPLRVDVHLAPQDPRRAVVARGPLAKLRRSVPALEVAYVSRTGSGLYEQADPSYGELRYTFQGRTSASRVMTDDGVALAVLALAGLTPAEDDEAYDGHPLIASPSGAALVFYALWPAVVGGAALLTFRRRRP